MENLTRPLRVLFLDIEASDLQADIGHILCIGYKWAHEKKPHVISLLDYPGAKLNDDSKLLAAFEPIYNEADVVVYHFGEYYDLPFIQTRRLIHNMKRLPTCSSVDTWRIARNTMKFGSNRLERLLQVLKCPFKKTSVDLAIWSDARVGIASAFKYIVDHCRLDILVLEWVYNKIKTMSPVHPAMYLSKEEKVCKLCGESAVRRHGVRATQTGRYYRLLCEECGANYKGRKI